MFILRPSPPPSSSVPEVILIPEVEPVTRAVISTVRDGMHLLRNGENIGFDQTRLVSLFLIYVTYLISDISEIPGK